MGHYNCMGTYIPSKDETHESKKGSIWNDSERLLEEMDIWPD